MNDVNVGVEVPVTTLNQSQPTPTPENSQIDIPSNPSNNEDGVLQTIQESFKNSLETASQALADPQKGPGLLMLLGVILLIAIALLAIIFHKQIKKLVTNDK